MKAEQIKEYLYIDNDLRVTRDFRADAVSQARIERVKFIIGLLRGDQDLLRAKLFSRGELNDCDNSTMATWLAMRLRFFLSEGFRNVTEWGNFAPLPAVLTEQILSECNVTLTEVFELLDFARRIEKEELLEIEEVGCAIKRY